MDAPASPAREDRPASPRPTGSRTRSPSRSRSRSRGRHADSRSKSPSRSRSRSRNGHSRYRSRSRSYSRSRSRSFSRSRSRSRDAPKGTKIVVERLTRTINKDHLYEIFGQFGRIQDLDLPLNRGSNMNRGTAYILYHDVDAAERAIANMHESRVDNATINVSIVLPRRKISPEPPAARRGAAFDPRAGRGGRGGGDGGGRGRRGGSPRRFGGRGGGRGGRDFGRRSMSPPARGNGGGGGGGGYRSRSRSFSRSPRKYSRSRSRTPPVPMQDVN